MTKEEYLNTVLMTEDRGWLDRSDICEIASKAWDAAVEQSCEWLKENARHLLSAELRQQFRKAMEGKI